MDKRIFLWLALAWTLLIAILCLVSFRELPKVSLALGADKYVHAIFHFFFTILWYLHFRNTSIERKTLKLVFSILLVSLIYGIAIEFAQEFFTTTRQADAKDVAANFSGAFLALLFIFGYRKYQGQDLA